MPVDAKTRVLNETGDTDPATYSTLIDGIWDAYASTGFVAGLQELYTQRAWLDVLIREASPKADFVTAAGLSVKLSQKSRNLQAMRENVQAEIVRVEQMAAASGGATVGQLVTSAPSPPRFGWQQGDEPQYRGLPVWPYRQFPGDLP